MCLSERPFLYDIMGDSLKIWFSNSSGCVSISLGFLSDLGLLGGIMLLRARFFSLFRFVEGRLGSFLEISLLRVCCRSQTLPTGRLFTSLVAWQKVCYTLRFNGIY